MKAQVQHPITLSPVKRQAFQAMAATAFLVLASFLGGAARMSGLTPAFSLRPGGPADALVVIGTGGVSPSDIDPNRTPTLWGLMRGGSSAALNVTAVHINTCPIDGWLTLSAGDRAGQPDDGTRTPPCPPIPAVHNSFVTGWDALGTSAADRPYGSRLGTLSRVLASTGRCISAIGPGAGLAAALPAGGAVPRFQQFDVATLPLALAGCSTNLVDVGALRDERDAGLAERGQPVVSHEQQLAAVDQRVAQVLSAAPTADVIVVSLADAGLRPRLQVVLASGQRFPPGTLHSPSTRQPGLVQLDDITATILDHAGVAVPRQVSGAPLSLLAARNNSPALAQRRYAALVDYDLASRSVQPVVYPFFVTWVALMLVALAALAVSWSRHLGSDRWRESTRSWVRKGLVVFGAVPAATYLANIVPWWRAPWPPAALVLTTAVWSAVLGAIALRGGWRHSPMGPVGAVAALTFVVLAVDVMNGSSLQVASLLGLNPIVGGRYFGLGNVAFALLAAAAFLVAITLSSHLVRVGRRRAAALAVVVVGVLAVILCAVPIWGSKVGGPPALLPGFAMLTFSILQLRLNWRRVVLIGGGTVLLVLLIALLDWLRPEPSRSHLGRFVQSALDGDAADIISRKLVQNLDTLTHTTVFAYLVPLLLLVLLHLLARPRSRSTMPIQHLLDRFDTLRAGLVGLTVTMAVGMLANDTGVAIPPVALALALPLLVSAAIHTWEEPGPPCQEGSPGVGSDSGPHAECPAL